MPLAMSRSVSGQKNELKPWREEARCIGKPSAQYVAKMEDVLDVYHRAYDAKRPVVCLDESSKELRHTPRGNLSTAPGQPERQFKVMFTQIRQREGSAPGRVHGDPTCGSCCSQNR
jgi:hypothetical protein